MKMFFPCWFSTKKKKIHSANDLPIVICEAFLKSLKLSDLLIFKKIKVGCFLILSYLKIQISYKVSVLKMKLIVLYSFLISLLNGFFLLVPSWKLKPVTSFYQMEGTEVCYIFSLNEYLAF